MIMVGKANVKGDLKIYEGAQFWAYISPQDKTEEMIIKWQVKIEQQDGDWAGVISSDNPTAILHTPSLSGVFRVTVKATGKFFEEKILSCADYSNPDIGCNSNCFGMVGIVSIKGGEDANYWTVWDAICKQIE
jgi:hypothetical protein